MKHDSRRMSHGFAGLLVAGLLGATLGCVATDELDDAADTDTDALTSREIGFDGRSPGSTYGTALAKQDLGQSASIAFSEFVKVGGPIGAPQYGNNLRFTVPAGVENEGKGGKLRTCLWGNCDIHTDLPHRDTTLRWKIFLEKDWVYYAGDTKIGGIGGGANYTGGKAARAMSQRDGWSLRFMFNKGRNAVNDHVRAYYYGADMRGPTYGDVKGSGCKIDKETWYTMEISVRANTDGAANGRLRMYVRKDATGEVCTLLSEDGKRLADRPSKAFPRILNFETFRGGAGDAPNQASHVRVDRFQWNNYFYETGGWW